MPESLFSININGRALVLLKSDIAWAKVILHSEKKILQIVQFEQKTKKKIAINILVRVGCGPGVRLVGWGRGCLGWAQRWGGGGGGTSRAYNKRLWHNRDLFTCAVWPNPGHSAPPRALDLATQHK